MFSDNTDCLIAEIGEIGDLLEAHRFGSTFRHFDKFSAAQGQGSKLTMTGTGRPLAATKIITTKDTKISLIG